MNAMTTVIIGCLSFILLGFPTLLVIMAWVTRDHTLLSIRATASDPRSRHLARTRAARITGTPILDHRPYNHL
jgi:hypothetical protein